MSINLPVTTSTIRIIDIVRITVNGIKIVFSSSPFPIYNPDISNTPILGLGQLIKVGEVTRDIKSTANETTVALCGIEPTLLGTVLNSNIKGSPLEIWRAFCNESHNIIQNLISGSESLVTDTNWIGLYTAVESSTTYNGPLGQPDSFRVNWQQSGLAPQFYQDVDTGYDVANRTFNFSFYARKAGTDPSGYTVKLESFDVNNIPDVFDNTSGDWVGYCGNTSNITFSAATINFPARINITRDSNNSCGASTSWGLYYTNANNHFYNVGETYTVSVGFAHFTASPVTFQLGLDDNHMQTFTVGVAQGYNTYSATFTVTTAGVRGFQFKLAPAAAGTTYGAVFYDPRVEEGTKASFTQAKTFTGSWTRYDASYTFPSTCTQRYLRCSILAPVNTTASKYWLDCLQLTETLTPQTYVATAANTRNYGMYKYFTGNVSSYSITEDFMEEINQYVGVIAISASSIQLILQNKIMGRFTNGPSWKQYFPTDTSMDRVAEVATYQFLFGKDAPNTDQYGVVIK